LMARSNMFVQTLTVNLMTYALGREVDYRDMPTARRIVGVAAKEGNTFESIVYNVVMSNAFQMRGSYTSSNPKDAAQQQAAR
jgi:hypothetical protein